MSNWVFLNDEFVPEEKAVLHFRDLSIQRGYGVFDFLKVVNSAPVFLKEHLNRFYFSAEQMRLNVKYNKDEIKKIVFELLKKNDSDRTGVRITLTGGYSPDGYQVYTPNLILSIHPFAAPTKDQFKKGIKLITYEYQRQLPEVKSIDYLMAIWLQPFVKQNNADDVLYYQKGIVSECPRSNFFIMTNDKRIITPSKNILQGVTRMKLIEALKTDFEIEERELSIAEIKTARAAFITSSTKTVLPVNQIDEYIFPEDNTITEQIYHSLLQLQSTQSIT